MRATRFARHGVGGGVALTAQDVNAARARPRGIVATSAALVVLPAGALLALWTPRPVPPRETPGLHLDPTACAHAIAQDRALAAESPTGEAAERLRRALHALGTSQARASVMTEGEHHDTIFEIRRAANALGPTALSRLRASLVERLEPALALPADDDERRALLGDFEQTLDRFGLRRGGRILAPAIVVRALYKARFNHLAGVEPTDGLHDVERLAYWGWLALEADGVEPARRLAALSEYERLGGAGTAEARATLLFLAGRLPEAAQAFSALDPEGRNPRLRNATLAVLALSNESEP
ncbi:MAG: hypothetical protein NZ898_02030 [Myxococcota bacterium]|nr:hypothetical protein [Myxococcota bacterium]MDW8361588.1 hypothetical protein [Myxococcales bacterium]